MAYTVLEMDDAPADTVLQRLSQLAPVTSARRIHIPGATRPGGEGSSPYLFANGRELLDLCKRHDAGIGTVMRLREESLFSPGFDERMAHVLQVMRESSTRAIENPRPSLGGFIGGEARLLSRHPTPPRPRSWAPRSRRPSRAPWPSSSRTPPWASSWRHPPRVPRAWYPDASSPQARPLAQARRTSSRRSGAPQPWACCSPATPAWPAPRAAARRRWVRPRPWRRQRSRRCSAAPPSRRSTPPPLPWATCWALRATPSAAWWRRPARTETPSAWPARSPRRQLSLAGIKAPVPFDEAADAMLRVGRMLPLELRETALGGLATCPSVCSACRAS